MNDDVRRFIYGTIIGFGMLMAVWFSIIYVSSCGFTLNCVRAAPLVVRTPIPTLIPHTEAEIPSEPQNPAAMDFNACQVFATDLIGAWVTAGSPETAAFPFTDIHGNPCEGIFANDIQPLFVENNLWYKGSLGCTSCHNAGLTDRSSGLDLSSYHGVMMGTRRVPEATSPGTDILGRGVWEDSLLFDVLVHQGLVPKGHSPDVPPTQLILYAGQQVAASDVTATPTP